MSCREYEADIVDLARGAGVSVEGESRLREHVAGCAGCAARLAREQRLTAALREVADSAPQPSRSEAIEAQLLGVLAAQHAAGPQETAPPRVSGTERREWGWLAAAAALVVAVVVWRGAGWRPPPVATGPAPAPVTAIPAASLPPAPAASQSPPRRAEATTPAARLGASPQAVPARAGAARNPSQPAAAPAAEEGVLRFASLPTAIGLPALESGRIVRVELATAVLPAFGFDVVPASESGVVEADVLVGQDDQPRAIRFVSLEKVYRRRQ